MKKNIIVLTILGGLFYLILSSNASGPGFASHKDLTGASGAGYATNAACAESGCHSSIASTIAVTVELDSLGFAVSQYHAGASYTIKIKGVNNSASTLPYFGFQLSCVLANSNAAGSGIAAGASACVQAGTWGATLPTSVRATTVGTSFPQTIIEQSTSIIATTGTGGVGTTYVESIPWTAPAAGSGAVVIYGVLNAVNHNGSESGDICNIANTLFISEFGHASTCN